MGAWTKGQGMKGASEGYKGWGSPRHGELPLSCRGGRVAGRARPGDKNEGASWYEDVATPQRLHRPRPHSEPTSAPQPTRAHPPSTRASLRPPPPQRPPSSSAPSPQSASAAAHCAPASRPAPRPLPLPALSLSRSHPARRLRRARVPSGPMRAPGVFPVTLAVHGSATKAPRARAQEQLHRASAIELIIGRTRGCQLPCQFPLRRARDPPK